MSRRERRRALRRLSRTSMVLSDRLARGDADWQSLDEKQRRVRRERIESHLLDQCSLMLEHHLQEVRW